MVGKKPHDRVGRRNSDIGRLASDVGHVASAMGSIVADGVRQVFRPERHAREQEAAKELFRKYVEGSRARARAQWPDRAKQNPSESVWDVIDREGWRIEDATGAALVEWSVGEIRDALSQHLTEVADNQTRDSQLALDDPRWIWGEPSHWSASQISGRVLFVAELAFTLRGDESHQAADFPQFCYPPGLWRKFDSHPENWDIFEYFRVSCRSLDDAEKIRSLATIANRVADELAAGRTPLRANDLGILLRALAGAIDGEAAVSATIVSRLRRAGGQMPKETSGAQSDAPESPPESLAWKPRVFWRQEDQDETAKDFFVREYSHLPKKQRPFADQILSGDPAFYNAIKAMTANNARRGKTGRPGTADAARTIGDLFPTRQRRKALPSPEEAIEIVAKRREASRRAKEEAKPK